MPSVSYLNISKPGDLNEVTLQPDYNSVLALPFYFPEDIFGSFYIQHSTSDLTFDRRACVITSQQVVAFQNLTPKEQRQT